MQICSELLIEKMFYYKFFCQTIQCPQKEGGRIPPPSDVSPTEKHADVTRVKTLTTEPSNLNWIRTWSNLETEKTHYDKV